MLRRIANRIGGYCAGLVTVALITSFYVHEPVFKTTTIVLTYLLAILIASTIWGLGVSIMMTLVATLACDYYFFPPVGFLTMEDPQDWVTACSFLVTSVIGSELSARARRQAQVANRQRNEMRRLYEFSQHLLNARNPIEMLDQIPSHIVETFQASAAALYLPGEEFVHHSGTSNSRFDLVKMKDVHIHGEFEIDEVQTTYLGPVRLGTQVIASFGVQGSPFSMQTLHSLSSMIASAIDRAQAIELVGKIEAARENERLKSVLLDAIAHDFKTPLTSIKAAATSLLDDLSFNKRQRGDLLEVIDEECDRINHVIGEAIEMARLDAGEVTLQLASHSVRKLISAVLEDCPNVLSARSIRTEFHAKSSCVLCDLFWTKKVLDHLIQNANSYSTPGEPITITTEEKDGFIYFRVSDVGPGIDKAEIGQIFEKFYRGKNHRYRVAGTGMGLAVSKAIIETHGGKLVAASEPGHGSVFTFNLPAAAQTTEEVESTKAAGTNDEVPAKKAS